MQVIIYKLFSGLQHLHKGNVTHNDIKPENLIYDRDSRQLKIIDFGLAYDERMHEMQHTVGWLWHHRSAASRCASHLTVKDRGSRGYSGRADVSDRSRTCGSVA